MNRFLHYASAAAGLAAVGWVGIGYVGANPLALAITLLIAVFYVMGLLELHRFQQATVSLSQALATLSEPQPPAGLAGWLDRLHPSLRNAARLRIEGERVGLPGPAMTPYLAGLLVLLGMLGTFLGMVVTLNGTGTALAGATDLDAIRASLSAPVKGLGLAFGTSVAGVAASAMLGLVSALCRRERLQAGQLLDAHAATTLRTHSLAHRREESFKLLQQQAHGMPALVDRLEAMMSAMERQGQALHAQLIASQDRFHSQAGIAYAGLASSVDQTLRQSLLDSARAASVAIQPVVEATMAGIARETASLHDGISRTVHLQLDGLSSRFEATTGEVAGTWQAALAAHQRTAEAMSQELGAAHERLAESFAQRSAALVDGVSTRLAQATDGMAEAWRDAQAQQARAGEALQADLLARDEQRLAAWTASLGSAADTLQQAWQHTGAQTAQAQRELLDALARTARDMSATTEAHARSTIAEIAQLLQVAAEAPRAAAEVVAELRQKLADSVARDNAMLEERNRMLETLSTLLDAVNHASTEQRTAVDALVTASADVLERVGNRFTDTVEAETGKLASVAAQVTGSAVEVASLGEAFGLAVQLFSESNDKLVGHLQRIEGALGKSLARSDEQLAYYVAQAREVIDLSIMSQKQVVEDLQQIAGRQALAGSDA